MTESRDSRCVPGQGVVAILLAAGRSRRMGRPKQLLRLAAGEGTLVQAVAAALRPQVERLIVVVGHVGGQVAALLAGQDLEIAVNHDVDRGMLSSVQCGIHAAGSAPRGYLVCLGDQPAIDAGAIRAVLEAVAAGAGIVVPTWSGRRGHPVFIARRHAPEVLSLDPLSAGLHVVTRGHPEDTVEVAVDTPGVLLDLDTPADLDRERARRAADAGRFPSNPEIRHG